MIALSSVEFPGSSPPSSDILTGPAKWRGRTTAAALSLLLLIAAILHLVIMRGTTFYVDEWNVIFDYGWSPSQLLEPVNGHNALIGRLTWYLVMALFGIDSYLPFRVLGLAFNLIVALALFTYGSRRAGAVAGMALAGISLFLGSSFHTILWPAAAGGLLTIAALVLALLCLERDGTKRSLTTLALIFLALGSGGMGVVVYAATTVEIVLRRQLARWWLVVLPAVVYLGWLVTAAGANPQAGFSLKNGSLLPSYVVDAMRYAVSGLFGLTSSWGTGILLGYMAMVMLMSVLNRGRIDFVRVASLATAPLTFWILTALFRGSLGEPGAPRYIAFGAIPLALVLLEMARGLPALSVATGAIAVAAVSVAGNLPILLMNGANFRHLGQVQRAELAALEEVRESVDADYVLPGEWARYVRAGSYFTAVDRFGSPAMSPADMVSDVEGPGTFADEVLVAGNAILAEVLEGDASCRSGPARVETRVHRGSAVTIVNRSGTPAELRLRRFAMGFRAEPWVTVQADQVLRLTARYDRLPAVPWRVHSSVPIMECRGNRLQRPGR